MTTFIQFSMRRDTPANWASANPILASGELGLDTTAQRFKIGNGATAWNSLAYAPNTIFSGAGAPAGALGVDGDIYFDVTNKGYYVKAAGSWGSIISLQGATGTTGATGPGVPNGGTTGQVLKKNSATNLDTSFADTPVDGTTLEITGNNVVRIKDGGVSLVKLANAAANTILANATAGAAAPSAVAIATNQFLARDSASNLIPKSVTDAAFTFLSAASAAAETALLDAATSALKGLILAAEKNRISTTDLWFDVVADGGIDRTGAVDGTVALQAAITTVGTAGGGIVYIPQNCSIKTSANINILFPNVTIKGGSRVTSRIVPTHATGNVFTANAANGFIRFENMRIQPTSFTLRTAGYGIEVVSGTANCSIQWVDILGMWSAIKASGQLCRMEDLGLRECGYGAINGCMILFDSFTDQYVKAVVCDNGTVAPNAPMAGFSGLRATSLSSLLMTDCQWIHCGAGLDVAPAGTNTIPSMYVLNCFFDQGTVGGNFVSGSGNILRSRFLGCWFSGNSVAGVVLNGASLNGLDFIGCEFYGAPSAQPVGIDAINAQEWSVRASRFAGNTIAIRTTATASHSFSVTDNIIGNVSLVGANGQGITVQAGTYKRYQILDNRGLESNTTPGINDLGVVGVTDQKNVGNNMGALLKGQLQLNNSGGGAVSPGRGSATVGAANSFLFGTRIPANSVSVGQAFEVKCSAQASSTGATTFNIHAGPLGTTADPIIHAGVASAVAIANQYVLFTGLVTVVALGAASNVVAAGQTFSNGATTGKTAAAEVLGTAPTTAPWFITVAALHTVGVLTVRQAAIIAL